MSHTPDIRDQVKAVMDYRGMSRRRLARETGLAKETVGDFLDDTADTRRASVVAICVHLGIEIPPVEQPAEAPS